MNTYGLYIQPYDIQRYIQDYTNYGIDYTGDDNMAPEDRIDKYWDDADGVEKWADGGVLKSICLF